MRNIAWLGVLLIACGLLLRNAPYTLPGYVNFYTTSPLYAMIRIGCVLILCFLLYKLEAGGKWIPRLIQVGRTGISAGVRSASLDHLRLYSGAGFWSDLLGQQMGIQAALR